jgi:hypothetical protein
MVCGFPPLVTQVKVTGSPARTSELGLIVALTFTGSVEIKERNLDEDV